MKCILLDDELPGLQYLRLICEQTPGLEVARAYQDPRKFLSEARDLDYDFAILDIHMPGLSGLEVVERLREKPVIFITGHKEYAAEAFDLDAVDYVRKPYTRERFAQAIRKMEERLAADTVRAPGAEAGGPRPPAGRLAPEAQAAETPQSAGRFAPKPAGPPPRAFGRLNSSLGKILLYFDEVLLITSPDGDPRDKRAFLEGGKEVLLKNISFDHLLTLLPGDQFARINKRAIVALKAVEHFSHDEVTTSLGRLPLSETYRAGFHYKK